ncbi:endogenous retrovirus group K member 13-1 Env polyprotein-like isoform X1 [Talpa occidentalis]|uniref:endogenous retrovirus group K member 13-1 Env polyprotein-like isoform X1 n=1 Tax=Talpa occidentalis TaxID=50954 RepID=UPI00188FC84A|nr:endogenous retrovirus group K member 13-1 Env polyprotein-like isoform X1 [Talpa occidentalis]XP_037374287.1 endogenous retrovirus group K member 13-1 Env polyprotein-like isoform X1 [Talpa occidentalis]XP_054553661.1 endogenous retrovirus group K member 13-1 Env polyprotein-like isoform X1 [Talpa occidentalis]
MRACVGPPHALLIEGPGHLTITYHHHTFHVNCTGCILTNCITSVGSLSKATFVILHQPPYVMLPVSLQQPWYDDIGLYTLQLVGQGLRRSKRFVAALILGITALIAIISSVAVSTTALVQQVHTASHVNDLSRNITHALIIQDHIDNEFEARLNVLEESLLHIGNQIQHIKTHLTTKCHSDYKWICVTPHVYNSSSVSWNNVKNHLLGVWNNTNVSLDLTALQKDIKAISLAHSPSSTPAEVAASFLASLQHYTTKAAWFPSFITLGVVLLVTIIILILFPLFIKLLFHAINKTHVELQTM